MSKELLYNLCSNFLKEKELYDTFFKLSNLSELENEIKTKFNQSQINSAKKSVAKMNMLSINSVSIFDESYPNPLRNIDYPPPILFYKGEYKEEDVDSVAVVGSRDASSRGKQLTEKLIKDLSSNKITIISGLAYGIDTVAHISALENNLRTIAVLGSGLDVIYPAQNLRLFEKISKLGVIFSEYPLGSKPLSYRFPKRNRIISGLSKAVIVVEANEKSGSLITAKIAMQQNKELFVFPRTPTDKNSQGNNFLIKIGAKIITDANDLIKDVFPNFKNPRNDINVTANISEEEKITLEAISSEPIHIDQLSFLLDIGPARLANSLLGLEMKGFIKELPGKYFIKS